MWEHRERTIIQNEKRSLQRLLRDDEAKVGPAGEVGVSQWKLSGKVDMDGEFNCARLDWNWGIEHSTLRKPAKL